MSRKHHEPKSDRAIRAEMPTKPDVTAPAPEFDPPRPPIGRHCEACGATRPIKWIESTKRYECGCSQNLPDGVAVAEGGNAYEGRPPRTCGTCRKPIAITALSCPHCTPAIVTPNVQNIATPSRVRIDGTPGLPWMRGR